MGGDGGVPGCGEGSGGAGERAEGAVRVRGAHVRPAGDGVSTVEGVRLTSELLTMVTMVLLVVLECVRMCVIETDRQTVR